MLSTYQIRQIEKVLFEVGDFQCEHQTKLNPIQIEEKSLNQLVSYVDIESEKKLVKELKKITPSAGFLTEEKTTLEKNPELYWIIDPLDGTTNYLFGHTKFAISIALYACEKPVYANVFVPQDHEMFSATPQGAFLNNTSIQISKRNKWSDTLIATGFPYYNFDEMKSYLQLLEKLMRETKGIRRMGSAAIDLAYTACGRFDAFYELNLSPWDVAGGAYIVQQAGGIVTDFHAKNQFVFGNSILASNVILHQKILSIIQQKFS